MIRSDQKLAFNYMLTDLVLLSVSYLVFFVGGTELTERHSLFLINYCALWMIVSYFTKIYFIHLHNSYLYRLMMYLRTHLIFIGILSFLYLLNEKLTPLSRTQLIQFTVTFMSSELIIHYLLVHTIGYFRKRGKNVRRALIVGRKDVGESIRNYFTQNLDLGYSVIGILDGPEGQMAGYNMDELDTILKTKRVDEIIVTNHRDDIIQEVIRLSDYYGIRTRVVPNYHNLLGRSYNFTKLGNLPIINVRETSLDNLYWAAQKRLFDVVFSSVALIFLLPVFALLAIAIKLESKGSVFYCPIRLGQGGREFKLYKFRSMYEGDTAGTMSTQKDDPRITKVGAFIRKYSLDELPQFINVLIGDMSVVGPRPHRLFLNQVMQKEVNNYMVRHYLKPGITGWAQVNGWRGPTDTPEQKQQRTSHDLWYLENWTFALDIKIIYMTIFSKKTHENVF